MADPFVHKVLAQQVAWSRLIAEVSSSAVAAMMLGDHSAAAEGFARCERLVLMIQESKRWLRIHEKGEASDG